MTDNVHNTLYAKYRLSYVLSWSRYFDKCLEAHIEQSLQATFTLDLPKSISSMKKIGQGKIRKGIIIIIIIFVSALVPELTAQLTYEYAILGLC